MSFLEREAMKGLLDELSTGDIDESRRVEIINEIGKQHDAGLEEYTGLQTTHSKINDDLNETRQAMAKMYNQLNSQNLGVSIGGQDSEPNQQETITLDDVLNAK